MDNEKEWEKLAGFFQQIDDWENEDDDEDDEDED
jgi:hypothetical protein